MKTIHKYRMDGGKNAVEMPKDARILHVGAQDGNVCLWAFVDTDRLNELRHFRVYETGYSLSGDFIEADLRRETFDASYIGTAQVGEFVWHVFERRA